MKRVLYLFAVIAIAATAGFTQGTRGTIRGIVTDANQAVVANATVRLIDVQQGSERSSIQTGADGAYEFLEIEPATYNIVITAPNFSETRIVDVKVEPNRNLTINAALSVGQLTNDVTVTAGVELIDRESPTLGTTVDRRRVEGLPLNGRNVLSLALLQPGVTPATGFGGGLGIRVNGSRGVENNLTLDGANDNEVAVGGAIGLSPRPDAVQEFRLLTSNFEAEFGRNTGSIINVVTKSGGNQYHGNARFFYRGTDLAATEFLRKALPPAGSAPGADVKQRIERKDYGFNIGGPIYFLNFGEGVPAIYDGKDRSFFFADYERRYLNIGASMNVSNLPTALERAGDFSAFLSPDPSAPNCIGFTNPDPGVNCSRILIDPATGSPFPGNIIPSARFSPIALYYLDFLPQGDAQGAALVSANQLTESNFFTTRVDHNITSNHILNFTFNYFDTNEATPFAFGGANVPGFGSTNLRDTKNYIGRYTAIISPKVVNSLLISYAKNTQPGVAPINATLPSAIGFTADFVSEASLAGPPQIRLLDRGLILGNSIQGPQRRITENMQIQDSVSYVLGSHRLKFGIDATKYKQDTDFTFINQGLFSYSADGLEGFTNTTGDDLADFLTGQAPAAAQYGANGARDYRQTAFAGFAQDSWRASTNLTLSFGVRYEYVSPLKDLFDRVAYYRPGATSTLLATGQLHTIEGQTIVPAGRLPRGLVYVGDPDPVLGGTVPRGGVAPDKNNIAPRVGFAYSFSSAPGYLSRIIGKNQTVIRGGYGLYYGAVIGDTALQQLTAQGYNGTNAFFFPASGTLADPFAPDPFGNPNLPQTPNPFAASSFVVPTILTQFSQPTDPNLKTPQVQQFNLTLERGFAKDYVVGISYVGSRGHKLYVREAINPSLGTLLPASLRPEVTPVASTGNSNSRRLNDDIRLALNQLTSGGNSQYDSFQANFQKRLSSDGLLFQLAYTFSKSITDADSQRGQLDYLDRRFGRGLSSDDHPHRFVGSFLYDIPFFKNTNSVLKRLIDGWSVGGIYTYQSGDLITVGNPIDTTGTGGAIFSFADIGAPFEALDGVKNDRRGFNSDAFTIADCRVLGPTGAPVTGQNFGRCINADGTMGRRGTSGINQFRLDNPINSADAILQKRIQLFSESNNLELRFEAFNLFNTTQFSTINLNLSDVANFGRYNGTRAPREIQLGIRLNF